MLKTFYPHEYMDSTYEIDFQRYYNQGYRGVIFDIDNTLVPHNADADQRAIELFQMLRRIGFATCLLSNNKEPRVQRFNEQIQSQYIYKAGKPLRKGYEKAMERMGTTIENTLFVGDQLFTDVWGAKLIGIHCILVKPMNPKEEIQIVLKRYLEKIVLRSYVKRNNIILIGFMGSGKSTVGKKTAEALNCPFLDTDSYIEAKEGMPIPDIFAQKSEQYFRELETAILEELITNTHNTVIATGGGLPLAEANIPLLRNLGSIVYLRAKEDTIYDRVKDCTTRPLLQVENPKHKIHELLEYRDPIYSRVCDKVIETDNCSVENIVRQIKNTKFISRQHSQRNGQK